MRTDEIRARLAAATVKISEFPEYEVDMNGNIWSSSNWRGYGKRQIVPIEGKSGYLKVRLTRADGTRANRYVHRLVADAFLGVHVNGLQVRHLNGNRTDNRAENLAWGTAKENADDREMCGTTARGERNGFSKLSSNAAQQIRNLSKLGYTQREIAQHFGVSQTCVGRVINHDTWKTA